MNYLGGVSGATLGYISGGVRGARAGYKYGYQAGNSFQNKRMPPLKRKRTTSTSGTTITGSSGSRKRTMVPGSFGSGSKGLKRNLFKSRRHPVGTYNTGDIRSVIKKTKKKTPALKKVRKVKVSGLFTKKVKQVLTKTTPKGLFQENFFGTIEMTTDSNSRINGIAPETMTGGTALTHGYDYQWTFGRTRNTQWSFDFFKRTEFMDACEVLFFNKIAQSGVVNSAFRTATSFARIEDPFGLRNTPFRVIDSSVNMTMKNNGRRKYEILVYRCNPKMLKPENFGAGEAGAVITNTALCDWYDSHEYDNQSGGYYQGTNIDGTVIGPTDGTNQNGINPNHLNCTPFMTPRFTKQWSFGVQKIILEPGQETSIYIQGPKNCMFDHRAWKMKNTPKAVAVQHPDNEDLIDFGVLKPGWSQSVFFVIKPDILPTGDGGAGRFGTTVASSGANNVAAHQIAIQCTKTFRLQMPETTGSIGIVPAVGTQVSFPQLNRKYVYYLNTWPYGGVTTRAHELDVQNPADDDAIALDEI